MEPIHIFYFSDVLCVWAYIAQIRLDELKTTFEDKIAMPSAGIAIAQHFVPVFGVAREKLENRWREKGGLQGYSDHVQEVAKKYATYNSRFACKLSLSLKTNRCCVMNKLVNEKTFNLCIILCCLC